MDARILDLFMKENDAWDDLITRQSREIPTLEKMLSEIILEKKGVGEETLANVKLLKQEMHVQEKYMDELKELLAKQQHFLAKERKSVEDPFAINTVSSQNILREKIRTVEKTFLELKCNFLNYLATIL
jgi:flagellar biosynthesis chaperone FliJ